MKSRRDGREGGGIQPSLRDSWAVRRPGFPVLKRWVIITKSLRDEKMPKPTREQSLPRERLPMFYVSHRGLTLHSVSQPA
jgi:hypothetical protein